MKPYSSQRYTIACPRWLVLYHVKPRSYEDLRPKATAGFRAVFAPTAQIYALGRARPQHLEAGKTRIAAPVSFSGWLVLNRRRISRRLRLTHFTLVMPSDVGDRCLGGQDLMNIRQKTLQLALARRAEPLQPGK